MTGGGPSPEGCCARRPCCLRWCCGLELLALGVSSFAVLLEPDANAGCCSGRGHTCFVSDYGELSQVNYGKRMVESELMIMMGRRVSHRKASHTGISYRRISQRRVFGYSKQVRLKEGYRSYT